MNESIKAALRWDHLFEEIQLQAESKLIIEMHLSMASSVEIIWPSIMIYLLLFMFFCLQVSRISFPIQE